MKLTYWEMNSGGYYRLKDEDYKKLKAVGWKEDELSSRQLTIETNDVKEEIERWSDITGLDPGDIGCTCCGYPHTFYWESEDGTTEYMAHHRSTSWSV